VALRVKCKCGKVLAVSSKLADKRIACPACKAPFRIPLAKFPTNGKSATARAPSAASPKAPVIQTAQAAVAQTPARVELEPAIADLSGTIGVSPSGVFGEIELEGAPKTMLPPAPVAVDVGDPVELSYARDHVASTLPAATGRMASAAIEGPKRTYWSDAFGSFVYPFRSAGNIINFIVISVIAVIAVPMSFVVVNLGVIGFALIFGIFVIFGWLRAMYLSVVQDTAAGSDDMPGIKMEDGFLEDVIKPAFKYMGSYAVALAPAALYLIGMFAGLIPSQMQSAFILYAWVIGGFFIWPIVLMLFAFNALDMIYRVDLIFATIFRTIGPYLSLWFMLLVVGAFSLLPSIASLLTKLGLNVTLPLPSNNSPVGLVLFRILDVYFSIVTMRLVGLYYLHFKRRFAIVLE
jgi:hypothetical protein